MNILPTLSSNISYEGTEAFGYLDNTNAYKLFDNNINTFWEATGGAAETAEYIYWKIDRLKINTWDEWWSISELQLSGESQTAYTSSNWATVTTSVAVDDSTGKSMLILVDGGLNNWVNMYIKNAANFWIKWQFPSATPVCFVRQGGWYGYRYINQFRLQGSNDNSTWTTVYEDSLNSANGAYQLSNGYGSWTRVNPVRVVGINLVAPINTLDSYTIRSSDATKAPTDFTLQGFAIDSFVWTNLDSRTAVTDWVSDISKTYSLTLNRKSYSGLRLLFPILPTSGLNISELSATRLPLEVSDKYEIGTIKTIPESLSVSPFNIDDWSGNKIEAVPSLPNLGSGQGTQTRPTQGQLYPRGIPPIS